MKILIYIPLLYLQNKQNNGGKCGICGDPYNGRRDNEPPSGKYATGVIVKTYKVCNQEKRILSAPDSATYYTQ